MMDELRDIYCFNLVTFYTGLLILSTIGTFMVLLLHIVVPKSTKPPEAPRWLYSFQTWLFHSKVGKLWLKILVLTPPEQVRLVTKNLPSVATYFCMVGSFETSGLNRDKIL